MMLHPILPTVPTALLVEYLLRTVET